MKAFLILSFILVCRLNVNAQNKFNLELNIGGNSLQKETITFELDNRGLFDAEVNNLEKKVYFFIQTIGNYNILNFLTSGIGIEFNKFDKDFNLISIIANSKIVYPLKIISPFVNLSLGYGINTQNDYDGGLQYEAGLGINFYLDKRIDLMLIGNYKVMNTELNIPIPYVGNIGIRSKYEFINFSTGIRIKL